jgi:hypothetical protein
LSYGHHNTGEYSITSRERQLPNSALFCYNGVHGTIAEPQIAHLGDLRLVLIAHGYPLDNLRCDRDRRWPCRL